MGTISMVPLIQAITNQLSVICMVILFKSKVPITRKHLFLKKNIAKQKPTASKLTCMSFTQFLFIKSQ